MKRWYKIMLLLVVLAAIYYIIRKIDLIHIYEVIKKANYELLVLAFLSMGLSFLSWNYRYYKILRHFKKGINFFSLFPILMSGVLINTVTPTASSGGEPLMAYLASRKYKIKAAQALALTILDKVYNAIIFFFITLYCVLFIFFFINIPPSIKATILTLLIISLIIILPFIFVKERLKLKNFFSKLVLKVLFATINKVNKRFPTFKDFELFVIKKIQYILQIFKIGLKDKHLITVGTVSTLLVWFFMYLSQYFVFKALNYDIRFNAILIVVSLAWLVGNLAVIPGGIGVFEATMIALYSAFGINLAIAGLATLITRIIYYTFAIGIGYLSLLYTQFHIK